MENTNFAPYLELDEVVLWQGRPEKGNYIKRDNIFTIPFGLFFFLFACVWAGGASMASPLFALFALPFMAVGLYISFGTIIHHAILLSKTEYAITNKKLIRSCNGRIDIVYANQINNLEIVTNKDGTGTITFLRREVYYRGTDRHVSYPGGASGFHAIENVKDVIRVQQKINEMEK